MFERLQSALFPGKAAAAAAAEGQRTTFSQSTATTTTTGFRLSQQEPRQLFVNISLPELKLDPYSLSLGSYRPADIYATNQIRTAKYTLLTFIPKNLFEQFRRVANTFFLLLVILQAFPQFETINVGVVAMPIIFIVVVTAIKDAVEDFKRWKNDRAVNERKTAILDPEHWHNMNYPYHFHTGSLLTGLKSVDTSKSIQASSPTTLQQEKTSTVEPVITWKDIMWKDLRVGDVVYLKNDDPIPADIVILSTSETDNICYIETKNLDGETNLKLRQGPSITAALKAPEDFVRRLRVVVDSEPPSVNLLRYHATLSISIQDRGLPVVELPKTHTDHHPVSLISKSMSTTERIMSDYGLRKTVVDINGILLRGAILKNTKWVVGVVVFTGEDSKQIMNSGITPSKRSRVDRMMNPHVGINLAFMIFLCTVSAIGYSIWLRNNLGGVGFFLIGEENSSIAYDAFLNFWAALILYQNIVPISLYITIEFVKTIQAYFIHSDIQMYYPANDTPCSPRNWNLSDDLGQIEYIFSDKTGTLTRNIMEFKKCSIGGVVFDGSGKFFSVDSELNSALTPHSKGHHSRRSAFSFQADWVEGVPDLHGKASNSNLASAASKSAESIQEKGALWSDPVLNEYFDNPQMLQTEQGTRIRDFFSLLSICHTVLVDDLQDTTDANGVKTIAYKAQSPDEACLVTIAAETGFVFKKREFNSMGKNEIVLDTLGVEERFVLLNVIEFDSDRKRMSVIVRPSTENGVADHVILFCKGADSVIFERLAPGQDKLQKKTTRHLEKFAEDGLRTLCLAYRKIPIHEYETWGHRYQEAISIIYNDASTRASTLEKLNNEIEDNMILLGATAIEDKLQDGVPDCIMTLSAAGIKIWVLTGDKVETAINIGFLCGLLKSKSFENGTEYSTELSLIQIRDAKGDEEASSMIESALQKFWRQDGSSVTDEKYALIIDGQSLKFALDNEKTKENLLDLSCRCNAVICCRVSPLQKAKVVNMVKSGKKVMTLAIGDGANDVSMIQAADVGVGISGEEGMQAAMSSDYAIAQFAFLTRLLLVHGRWSYSRISYMILNFYLKSCVFTLVAFWFQFYCGFSSSILYDYTYMLFYNTVFTCLPIAVLAIFDQDVKDSYCIRYPPLYGSEGITRSLYTHRRFFIYLGESTWHSLVCMFVTIWSMAEVPISSDGKSSYGLFVGTAMAASAILDANLSVALDVHSWNWMTHVFIWITCLTFFIYVVAYTLTPGSPMYGSLVEIYGNPVFWLTIILCVALSLGPRFVYYYGRRVYKPTDGQVISEMQLLENQPTRSKKSAKPPASDVSRTSEKAITSPPNQLQVITDVAKLGENDSNDSPALNKRSSIVSIGSISYSMQTGSASKPHGFSFSHTEGMGNIVLRSPLSLFPSFSAFSRRISQSGSKSRPKSAKQANDRSRQPSEHPSETKSSSFKAPFPKKEHANISESPEESVSGESAKPSAPDL